MDDPIRIRVCLAAVENGKLLLVPMYGTDVGPVQWSIPGGGLAFGEGLHDCALREFEEETGLKAAVTGLLDVSEVLQPDKPYHSVTMAFSGNVVGGRERPEPQHRHGDKVPRWFSAQELAGLEYHPRSAVEKALGVG